MAFMRRCGTNRSREDDKKEKGTYCYVPSCMIGISGYLIRRLPEGIKALLRVADFLLAVSFFDLLQGVCLSDIYRTVKTSEEKFG